MKVIKRNKKHLWVECDHCGSILEPSNKDFEEYTNKIHHPSSTIIRNDKLYVLTEETTVRLVYCPVCKHSIKADRKIKESYEQL